MKSIRVYLLLGLGTAGLLCGYAGKRLLGGRMEGEVQATATAERPVRADAARIPNHPGAGLPRPAKILSTDTLESLATADAESLYGRLAAWLMEANEPDIAAYWASVKDKPRTNDITDLVFIHWTRLDPQAAIAAVAGTGSEHYAWWAWSCHDPADALKAAIAANPDRVNNVAWGIGEFHPAWLLAHFDEIPESGRGNAISGLTKWDDTDQPLEILNFLKQHGNQFKPRIFEALVRKDPWAAYDWMNANPPARNGFDADPFAPDAGDMMNLFIKTTAESQPDALERLAAQTPSGDLKRRMEAALFGKLLETDPAAALEQANATKAPVIAAQRLAAVGLKQLESDPDQAFEIAGKMFAANPECLRMRTLIQAPNGDYSLTLSRNGDVSGLVDALIARDPAQVMAMQSPPKAGADASDTDYVTIAAKWAQQDLAGYTDWVKQQTDPAIRDAAALPVVTGLTEAGQFAEAAEWVMNSTLEKDHQLFNLLHRWRRSAPDEASQWLEAADLPAAEKSRLNEILESNQ